MGCRGGEGRNGEVGRREGEEVVGMGLMAGWEEIRKLVMVDEDGREERLVTVERALPVLVRGGGG
jgi:hypothetical protein